MGLQFLVIYFKYSITFRTRNSSSKSKIGVTIVSVKAILMNQIAIVIHQLIIIPCQKNYIWNNSFEVNEGVTKMLDFKILFKI